jgi:hypothetical protein
MLPAKPQKVTKFYMNILCRAVEIVAVQLDIPTTVHVASDAK